MEKVVNSLCWKNNWCRIVVHLLLVNECAIIKISSGLLETLTLKIFVVLLTGMSLLLLLNTASMSLFLLTYLYPFPCPITLLIMKAIGFLTNSVWRTTRVHSGAVFGFVCFCLKHVEERIAPSNICKWKNKDKNKVLHSP